MFDETENLQQPDEFTEQAPAEPINEPAAEPAPEPETFPREEPAAPPPFVHTGQPQYVPTPVPPKPKKKPILGGKAIALVLCLSLLGGILGTLTVSYVEGYLDHLSGKGDTTLTIGRHDNVQIDINTIESGQELTPAQVYAANVNSTVGITTSVTTNYWGIPTTSAASGSGFIITKDGYVVTNYHVVEGSSSITVTFYDGNSTQAALVGYDANNDIAILKVNAENLQPVVLGDSANMNVGDPVVAIGNPLGELTFTLTSGIVSALNREVTTSSGVTMNLIQTDCAINSGNSGGALFNMYGEVIGITNAKYSSNGNSTEASIDNIAFAIPMNQVRSIVQGIIEKGYYSKPYIGVSVTDVSEETQSYGLPQGAAVKTVTDGAPADKAGLQVNDIITKANDIEITGSNDLVSYVGSCKPGQTLHLTVYRMGAYIELELTVGEQKQTGDSQAPSGGQSILPW